MGVQSIIKITLRELRERGEKRYLLLLLQLHALKITSVLFSKRNGIRLLLRVCVLRQAFKATICSTGIKKALWGEDSIGFKS